MDFDKHGRIKCGTVCTPQLEDALADYRDLLGLRLVEEGKIEPDLAAAWGAPASAGQRYALLQPESGVPSFLRLVEAPIEPEFVPTRTFGWAAFEFSVRDVYGLAERVKGSGFETVGPPKPIEGLPYFVPMQVVGRGREMLYFNEVAMDTPSSDLPKAVSEVDHIFIVILATPDRPASLRHLREQLKLDEGGSYTLNYTMINKAFGLADGTQSTITMVQSGRLPIVEVDGYPEGATARKSHEGMLPPGNAIVTLAVTSLSDLGLEFISPPTPREGPLYAGRLTATHRGSAGELIELIELG
jgi:catechol 2,3-dioxygenase-like lactoylglutathione lyase family enzyme